jgi:hypothetical protein
MNWTGIGFEISRDVWGKYKHREEFDRAGIYILVGYQEEDDLPMLYIGQGDGVRKRIDSHEKNKSFWDKALVFVSNSGGLNRAKLARTSEAVISISFIVMNLEKILSLLFCFLAYHYQTYCQAQQGNAPEARNRCLPMQIAA